MSTFLLVPGAGGEAWYWHLVVPELEARGHAAVAVGLPAGDDGAGLAAYADVIAAAGAGRGALAVVAQSMGALSAPLVASRLPVERLFLVAPMIPAPGETGGEWWEATGQVAAERECALRDGRDPDAPFDPETAFLHDLPPAVRADALTRGAPEQSSRPFADPWPLTAWPAVPTHVIAGRHDRLFPLGFLTRLARERLGLEPEVVDAGHLVALSRPRELAARLDALARRAPA